MSKEFADRYPDIELVTFNNPVTYVKLKSGFTGKAVCTDEWNEETGFWCAYAKAQKELVKHIAMYDRQRQYEEFLKGMSPEYRWRFNVTTDSHTKPMPTGFPELTQKYLLCRDGSIHQPLP